MDSIKVNGEQVKAISENWIASVRSQTISAATKSAKLDCSPKLFTRQSDDHDKHTQFTRRVVHDFLQSARIASNLDDVLADGRTHLFVNHQDNDSLVIETTATSSARHLDVFARRYLADGKQFNW